MQGVISEKSGEVLLLRDKVSNVERLLHSEKQVKLQEEKSRKIERSQKEIELEKRVRANISADDRYLIIISYPVSAYKLQLILCVNSVPALYY